MNFVKLPACAITRVFSHFLVEHIDDHCTLGYLSLIPLSADDGILVHSGMSIVFQGSYASPVREFNPIS